MPLPCYSLAKGPVLFAAAFQPDAPLHSLKGKMSGHWRHWWAQAFRLKAHRRSVHRLRGVSQVESSDGGGCAFYFAPRRLGTWCVADTI